MGLGERGDRLAPHGEVSRTQGLREAARWVTANAAAPATYIKTGDSNTAYVLALDTGSGAR